MSRFVSTALSIAFLTAVGFCQTPKILVLNLDRTLDDTAPNPNGSAPVIQALLTQLGYSDVSGRTVTMNDHATLASIDYSPYQGVFVCNGVNQLFLFSHVFTSAEGQRLVAYLNQGGKVYMEGGDVWYSDPTNKSAFNFLGAFKLTSAGPAQDTLYKINGLPGNAVSDSMLFDVNSDCDGFRDLIAPGSGASKCLENRSKGAVPTVSNVVVTYSGTTYRTIASALRFSGLVDGGGVSKKLDLLGKYLKFLGLEMVCTEPAVVAHPGSRTVPPGGSAALAVTATGSSTLHYQWYQGPAGDVTHPVGSDSPSFTTPAMARTASFWARVSNSCGSADSRPATVAVSSPGDYEYYCVHVAESDLWWTTLSIVNRGPADNPVVLELLDVDGNTVDIKQVDSLPPYAQFSSAVSEIFGDAAVGRDLWMAVLSASKLSGVVEFGTKDGLSLATLPLFTEGRTLSYFPYVVYTQGADSTFYTGLTLVNVSDSPGTVTLDAYSQDGTHIGTSPAGLTVPGRGKYVRMVDQVFPAVDPAAIRFVKVSSSSPCVGFELFGKWGEMGLAGLPLFSEGRPVGYRGAAGLESGIAPDGSYASSNLYFNELPVADGYYTGITFSSVDPQPRTVRAALMDGAGSVLAEKDWAVNPYQQVTKELSELFDNVRYPSAAYLKLASDAPLMGFELYLSGYGTGATFQFDGIAALPGGRTKNVFPVVRVSGGFQSTLGITGVSGGSSRYVVRAYGSDGSAKGAFTGALAGGQKAQLDLAALFPEASGSIAWVSVEGEAEVVAHVFMRAADSTRSSSYIGLAGD